MNLIPTRQQTEVFLYFSEGMMRHRVDTRSWLNQFHGVHIIPFSPNRIALFYTPDELLFF